MLTRPTYVERVGDAAKFVVDIYLGAVTQPVVGGEHLERLPVLRLETFCRNRDVDDCKNEIRISTNSARSIGSGVQISNIPAPFIGNENQNSTK